MSASYPSPHPAPESPLSPSQKLALHLNGHAQSMDGRQNDYSQPDQASAAQYPAASDPRSANFSSSATPTSEYGINPSSARSGSFPDYVQRGHYPPAGQPPQAGNMAQATNPSIAAAASPTYPPHGQYSPYPPQHEMSHYGAHPAPVYGRPDQWGSHYPGMYGHAPVTTGPPAPSMVSPVQRPPTGGHPLSTVYSFVPIPGAQQHKRPRRRYEEIERMYKCGWNGCEKAYGTLNHLNAHVTMQSHGQKRTPEEFKEIRKEWKAKKKEEEAQRKAEEERQRQAEQQRQAQNNEANNSNPETPIYGQPRAMAQPVQMGGPQLPPIGYAPAASGQAPAQYGTQSPSAIGEMAHYPQSPYTQGQTMYQQPADNGSNFQQ
ncbi:C2H2 finger domain transcription factor CON7 [Lasiodiplodia hormozganensis]|uniref:C2H2 finger domain transcription factor CON7 n=2 Tax=Lasiodiplodia TaxID=66739 RepID=A0A5N5DPT9_9PEZI|nr:C2H2 finger domain transcription factor CON7 [Lasiodiplodia theobromae]KAK0662914.1 C2H2 finger domain transcription factor CON7 [Lasiodiplodia hormozganensis]